MVIYRDNSDICFILKTEAYIIHFLGNRCMNIVTAA